jgi:polyhydroxybutyrate depolymerase
VTVCESPGPMSALIIHGTADATVPYNGGETNPRTAARFGQWENASVQDAVNFWIDRDDCVDGPSADGTDTGQPRAVTADAILTETWTECAAPTRLELVSITGGTHVWPTLENESFDASRAILEYFGLS